jgi:hypothetical protein
MDDMNAPATKADMASVEAKLEGKIDAVEARLDAKIELLRSEMNHQYHDLIERMRDGQTELLKAFYNFGTTNNKRMAELEGNEAAIRSRLGTLEERIFEIEKRLNLPPAA